MYKEKASTRLFLILFVIFMLNCFGKMAFSAVTASLVSENIMTRTQAGTIGAFFWIAYAVGQIIGSWAIKKYSPISLIFWGVFSTAVLTFIMPFGRSYTYMFTVWSLNGIVQFGIYPAILLLISRRVLPEHRHKALYYLSYSFCAGSMLSYLLTSVVLKFLSWRFIFYIIGAVMLLGCVGMTYVKNTLYPHLPADDAKSPVSSDNGGASQNKWSLIFSTGMIIFFVSAFFKSFLDNGIKTWVPTMLMQEFDATASYTSFLTTGLLVVNLFGVGFCEKIYKKLKGNENFLLLASYLVIFPAMILLIWYEHMNIYIVTLIMTFATVLMYGSGMAFLTYAPARFQKFGLTASLAGIINSLAAAGNVVGVYANGKVADLLGWNALVVVWVIAVAAVILVNLLGIKRWKKFVRETSHD